MNTIAFGNIKGGPGKTTISVNFACISANSGKNTLLFDMDPQSSSMKFKAIRAEELNGFRAASVLEPTIHQDIKNYKADNIFIDVGGGDTKIFRSAIMASDALITPIRPSQIDLWSTEETFIVFDEIREMYRDVNKEIKLGVVMNMVKENTNISKDVGTALGKLKEKYDLHLFKNILNDLVGFRESISAGKSVTEMKGRNFVSPSLQILNLYEEVMAWV